LLFNVIHYTKLSERLTFLEIISAKEGISLKVIDSYDKEKIPETLLNKIDTKKISLAEASCFLKHIHSFKLLVENSKHEYSIIIEDDVIFKQNLKKRLLTQINKLPDDFDLFFFGKSKINFKIPFYKKNLFKKDNFRTTWGGNGITRTLDSYVISKKCARKILSEFNELELIDDAVDAWINELARKYDFKGFWLKHPLTFNNKEFESSLESARWYD